MKFQRTRPPQRSVRAGEVAAAHEEALIDNRQFDSATSLRDQLESTRKQLLDPALRSRGWSAAEAASNALTGPLGAAAVVDLEPDQVRLLTEALSAAERELTLVRRRQADREARRVRDIEALERMCQQVTRDVAQMDGCTFTELTELKGRLGAATALADTLGSAVTELVAPLANLPARVDAALRSPDVRRQAQREAIDSLAQPLLASAPMLERVLADQVLALSPHVTDEPSLSRRPGFSSTVMASLLVASGDEGRVWLLPLALASHPVFGSTQVHDVRHWNSADLEVFATLFGSDAYTNLSSTAAATEALRP